MTTHNPTDTLDDLAAELGTRLLTDPDQVRGYINDRSIAEPEGMPRGVVVAGSADDVARALRWANRTRTPVSVRGAGTGLSGGSLGYPEGLVVSLEAMNAILDIDVENRLADVEPGVITSELDAAAREHGLFFAPDPVLLQSWGSRKTGVE